MSVVILALFVAANSLFILISGAAVIEDKSHGSTEESLHAGKTKRFIVDQTVCTPYDSEFPDGYCKHVLGNLPVFGRTRNEMKENESSMLRFNMIKVYFSGRRDLIDLLMGPLNLRQSCLAMIDDIYCHHLFKRCYISSAPQPVCRETCELFLKVCDQEIKIAKRFNRRKPELFSSWPYIWNIINCTTLPYRNETSNCYYPDRIREQLNTLESKDCFYGDGRAYHGNQSTTTSGYKCQSWSAKTDFEGGTPIETIYDEIRNSSNFCRNPRGFALRGPWCFTTNTTVRWQYCDVPRCAKQAPSSPPSDFRGHNLSSTSIQVSWGDVPKHSVNGILLGFHVACSLTNCSEGNVVNVAAGNHSCVIRELEKYRNYSCCLRAYNNFGNGTWSPKRVIATDEDVPSAPPQTLLAWNLSSTVLYAIWDPIPVGKRNGKILGYTVEIINEEKGSRGATTTITASRNATFTGLKKYSKYVVKVCGRTRRGKGPTRVVTVHTAEDVPDRPPVVISAVSLGPNAVQLAWTPVPPEYTNGKVLGYKVLFRVVNRTSRVNKTVLSSAVTSRKIEGLRPNTNYSFQILAFTAKGDGTGSASYFVRTASPDEVGGSRPRTVEIYKTTGFIIGGVFSGLAVLVTALIYVIKNKKRSREQRNDPSLVVTPYAASSPDWLDRIIATANCDGYEPLDNEDVASTSRRPLYINIAPDGSLNLPPNLRNIFLEFELSYENTRYKRLKRRRRSFGGAVDAHGPYDTLQHETPVATGSCQGKSSNHQEQIISISESSTEHEKRFADLCEAQSLTEAIQDETGNTECLEMSHMGCTTGRHRRRFSIDLGEVRKFIALTEI